MSRYSIVTIFPEIFSGFLGSSLVAKALTKNLITIDLINPRSFAEPPHYKVDDSPYGGGAGMVMKPEPLAKAISSVKNSDDQSYVVNLTPTGKTFTQRDAERLSKQHLTLIAGRYEGIDQRVIDGFVDEEISIGSYVLMGGEVAAMVIIEACMRLIPGVLGNELSSVKESFSSDLENEALLEAPHYTRPESFNGVEVPAVLLSGNHKAIEEWRQEQSRIRTKKWKTTSGV